MENSAKDVAIFFRTKHRLFQLFEIALVNKVDRMDGTKFCGIQFRVGIDVLGIGRYFISDNNAW